MRDALRVVSFLSLSTSTTTTFPPQFAPNPRASTRPGAPPLKWGMWAQIKTSKLGLRYIRPSPFQRDVGGSSSLDVGIGEGKTQGGTQGVGGPYSASRKRTMMNVVVRFLHFFVHSIQLTTFPQQAPPQGTTMTTTDHHAGLANATTTRPNDKRWSPTTEGRSPTAKGIAQRRRLEPKGEGHSPTTEGRTQWRRKV